MDNLMMDRNVDIGSPNWGTRKNSSSATDAAVSTTMGCFGCAAGATMVAPGHWVEGATRLDGWKRLRRNRYSSLVEERYLRADALRYLY